MSKHEKITTASGEPSAELIARVEKAYLAFRAKNPGKRYRRADLNAVIRTSLGPLCKAANIVEDRLDAIETRLAVMPEMPEELRLAQEQFLRELWVRTREIGSTEAAALRRLADEREARRLVEAAEAQELLCVLEGERDAALALVEALEKALADAQVENARVAADLARAEAKIEDREVFLSMMQDALGAKRTRSGRRPNGAPDEQEGAEADHQRPSTPNLPTLDV